jgi:hypothetical protein
MGMPVTTSVVSKEGSYVSVTPIGPVYAELSTI